MTKVISGSIVGLARSRTYWFSELLTYGSYHCFHCHPYYGEDIPEDKILLNSTCVPSDHHTGRVVVIERELEDSMNSFLKYIKAPLSQEVFNAMYINSLVSLEEAKKVAQLVVKYEDIDDKIWDILDCLNVTLPESWVRMMINTPLQSPDDGSSILEYKI